MRLLLSLLVTTLLISCGHGKFKGDPQYDEVMAIHDEVMPLLPSMKKLKKNIKKTSESLSPEALDIIKALDDADEGMMEWMYQFSPPEDTAERKSYLDDQKVKVQKVADDINNSIKSAKTYLDAQK